MAAVLTSLEARILLVVAFVAAAPACVGSGPSEAPPSGPRPGATPVVNEQDPRRDASTLEDGPESGAGTPGDPDTIVVQTRDAQGLWTSLNGAEWTSDGAGVQITRSANPHPILVPASGLDLRSVEAFTLRARVRSSNHASTSAEEFGILACVDATLGHAVGFGNLLNIDSPSNALPFLVSVTNVDFGGTIYRATETHEHKPDTTYNIVLRLSGADRTAKSVEAKLWESGTAEPSPWRVSRTLACPGGSVGFFTYPQNGAVLEQMTVTIP